MGDLNERPAPLTSRLSQEELGLVRRIGAQLGRMLQGHFDEVPPISRRDELGILTNMVAHVSRALLRAKEREAAHRRALEEKVQELEAARARQEALLEEIRRLSCPVIDVERGVLLVPLIGEVDAQRADLVMTTLLSRLSASGAAAVILDVTGVPRLDGDAAERLVRAAQAARLLGAQAILCGLSPEAARSAATVGMDFEGLRPCSTLAAALAAARRGMPR